MSEAKALADALARANFRDGWDQDLAGAAVELLPRDLAVGRNTARGVAYALITCALRPREPQAFIDIVFDGAPSAKAPRFVEVEDENGKSISIGEWINRGANRYWSLRIPMQQKFSSQAAAEMLVLLREILVELESEAEQRETSGNDEYSKGIRSLADRVRNIVEPQGEKQ